MGGSASTLGGWISIDFGSNFEAWGRGKGSKGCAPRFPASSRSKSLEILHLVPKIALYPFPGNMETNLEGHFSTNCLYFRESVLPKRSVWTVRWFQVFGKNLDLTSNYKSNLTFLQKPTFSNSCEIDLFLHEKHMRTSLLVLRHLLFLWHKETSLDGS